MRLRNAFRLRHIVLLPLCVSCMLVYLSLQLQSNTFSNYLVTNSMALEPWRVINNKTDTCVIPSFQLVEKDLIYRKVSKGYLF